jgi:hypothetical protein
MKRKPKFQSFRCSTCGDQVRPLAKAGRMAEYRRGVRLPVPDDFVIPTCPTCGAEYTSVELGNALAEAQRPAFLEWQRNTCKSLVQRIQAEHGVTIRDIETACAVSATYLSHVLNGTKEASTTLLRLIETFAHHPASFTRFGRVTASAVASAPHASPYEELKGKRGRDESEASPLAIASLPPANVYTLVAGLHASNDTEAA